MNTFKAKILLHPLLLLFLAFYYNCKQSEIELTDSSVINNSEDSISNIKPPTDYRKLCLLNPYYFSADSLYALRQLHLADPFYEKAALQFENDSAFKELIHTLNRLAWSNMILGEKVRAKQFLDKAEKLAETHLSDDQVLWADINRSLGYFYSLTTKYGESLKAYERSLNNLKRKSGNNSIKVAEIYLLIGNLYNWSIMDHFQASDSYFSALQILETNPERNQETYILCLYNLAVVNKIIGEYAKSKSYAIKMLQIIDQNNIAHQRYKEYGNSILADIYYINNDYKNAIAYYKKIIDLNINNPYGADIYLANYYNSLGNTYLQSDSIQKAIETLNLALVILEEQAIDSLNLSDSYENLALGYKKLGRQNITYEYLYKCLNIRRSIFFENHEQTSKAYLNLAQYFIDIGNNDSSLIYLKKSIESGTNGFIFKEHFLLPQKKDIGENFYLISALAKMADIYRIKYLDLNQIDNLNYSIKLFSLCDSLIDLLRNQLQQDDSKLRYASTIQSIYEKALETIYLLYEKEPSSDSYDLLYHFMEKNRARVLLDNIHSSEMVSKYPLPDSIHKKEKRLNYHLKHLNQLISEAENENNTQKIDSLDSLVFLNFRELEKLKEHIRINYPIYYQVQYQFSEYYPENIALHFPKTTFVEYFWGEQTIYAIGYNKNRIICYKTERDSSLEKGIKFIIEACNSQTGTISNNSKTFAQNAYYLYKKLVFPLIEDLFKNDEKISKSIVIIPDGLLSRLPFETLVQSFPKTEDISFKNLDYLVNNYEINYSFSSNFLAFLSHENNRNRIEDVLAFGYYENINNSNDDTYFTSGKISLAGTKRELDAISKYFNGRFLLGKDASESNFKKLCPDFDVIHLALHGSYDSLNNYNTFLQFNTSSDSIEDGKLYNYDLYPLNLSAKLAVLSACETGLGKNNPGEGLLSMGWGFAYSGCKSLLMSLWKADDRSTAQIMEQFYKQLSTSNKIGTSLAKAKRNYLINADDYTAHPKYWSAFVSYGFVQQSGILNRHSKAIYLAIIIIVLLITTSSLLFKKFRKEV